MYSCIKLATSVSLLSFPTHVEGSSSTKKISKSPGSLEVLTVREMTITCKAIGLGASRKFLGICKVPTGYSDFD